MNNTDKQYLELLDHIMKNGYVGEDRTGTGTKSVFGCQLRFQMSEGLPSVTTKKLHFKSIIYELIWFLGNHVNPESSESTQVYRDLGRNNILYLIDNNVTIWVGDCYKRYSTPSLHPSPRVYNPDETFDLTKKEFIEKLKSDYDFAKKWGDIGPGYGQQWRSWRTGKNIALEMVQFSNGQHMKYGEVIIDQIQELIEKLKTKPTDRRLMVSAWNVKDVPETLLPPCHYGFSCYTRLLTLEERIQRLIEGKISQHYKYQNQYTNYFLERYTHLYLNEVDLEKKESREEEFHDSLDSVQIPRRALSLKWNQRSCDCFLGIPFNILSYGILLEMLAKEVNMVAEDLIGSLENTHIYLNHFDAVNEQLSRDILHKLPTIWLNPNKNINTYCYEDIKVVGYESQNKIDAPLSN